MIGNVVEKYEVIQKIGEGGMATVYRGRHTTLGREVAIKVLHPHLSSSERNRMRFAREARAIEHLEHDNILRSYQTQNVTQKSNARARTPCAVCSQLSDRRRLRAHLCRRHPPHPRVAGCLHDAGASHRLYFALPLPVSGGPQ